MQIFVLLLLSLVFIILATTKFKIHPFITLLIVTLFMGIGYGLEPIKVIETIKLGFGKTLSGIGVIIAIGAIIGTFLEKSGATQVLANSLLKATGKKQSPLAINLTGFIVSIPVFCDSAFVILSSINKSLTKKTGIPLAVYAVALSTGLYVSHVFIPPTPGPLAASAELGADLGMVMLYGLIVALPVSLIGLFWAKYIGYKVKEDVVLSDNEKENDKLSYPINQPSFILSILPIIAPIILIGLKSIAVYPTQPLGDNEITQTLILLGNPLIALAIGLVFAFTLSYNKGNQFNWTSEALKDAGLIILITGAGGAFGAILRACEIGIIVEQYFSGLSVGILLPFVLAAILKTAQGSSTVAIITTAAIIAPLMPQLGIESETAKALTVLAIGAGAMTFSHVNDSYFWVVSQFSNMDLKTAFKTHGVGTLIQGVFAITIISVLYFILA